ncbi:MAG: L-glyceraldehyde 3-phosphate reductase [Clostridium sp.]|uniref:L-glyceraldehyde 3-phosphate reductase n=1 Tax=Clostridium TaxID=1485 RepID=UPI0011586912|nr:MULTISPECIES: L-glyceraldehyde 3-phosphate reductase [Clostridium]MBS5884445.1 L-glyceraldehyde 3-phosphate reductase [Clostridium sp.]MDU7147763.1 L-glyceraldehyde 3-phosphate reductase [Clostridium sp.]MDU7241654.1 L-glyceraldehyde 3-phosphate reductase [Clostridium sp.]
MHNVNENRYDEMKYIKCGNSGLYLPRVALGLWHNFGSVDPIENQKAIIFEAFNNGITHFDLANNYGPIYGSAEENFGRILNSELSQYRDEMIISTKAGYDMWPGPYGNGGSRKYLISSLDQSLKRMNLDYVDIFYHHRPDPDTPLEETMGALTDIVKQGKALYIGLSNYHPKELKEASRILKENGTPCLIHQFSYSMFNRWSEVEGLHDVHKEEGIGSIAFSPLAQGLLTNKYLHGIPEDSRAKKVSSKFLNEKDITAEKLEKIRQLNNIAGERGQTLAQMALAWVLRNDAVTTVLIGASKAEQIVDNKNIINNLSFSGKELEIIEEILK